MRRDDSFLTRAGETPVTYMLLIAYAVLMLPTVRSGGAGPGSLHAWAVTNLAAVGADIQYGEPWRLLSYSVVHGGLLHVGFNGMGLVWLGLPLERTMGSVRYSLLYATAALAGGIAGIWWISPWGSLVGGSGSLFGMMGAIVALNMRAGRHLLDFLDHAGARSLLGLICVNLFIGFVLPGISNAAHIGGLLAGFVLVFWFLEPGRSQRDGLGRAVQAGWVTLLLSTTAYSCAPTVRADYLIRRLIEAPTETERRPYARALAASSRADLPLRAGAPSSERTWLDTAEEFHSFADFLTYLRR